MDRNGAEVDFAYSHAASNQAPDQQRFGAQFPSSKSLQRKNSEAASMGAHLAGAPFAIPSGTTKSRLTFGTIPAKDLHRSCIEPWGIVDNGGELWAGKLLKPLKTPAFMRVRSDYESAASTTVRQSVV